MLLSITMSDNLGERLPGGMIAMETAHKSLHCCPEIRHRASASRSIRRRQLDTLTSRRRPEDTDRLTESKRLIRRRCISLQWTQPSRGENTKQRQRKAKAVLTDKRSFPDEAKERRLCLRRTSNAKRAAGKWRIQWIRNVFWLPCAFIPGWGWQPDSFFFQSASGDAAPAPSGQNLTPGCPARQISTPQQ